jgi:tRNA (guanine-N7-)-methyltransferase
MGQKKLIKFAAIKEYKNVLEFPQDMQGKWAAFFDTLKRETSTNDISSLSISDGQFVSNVSSINKEDNASTPLTLELACGRGEYAVGLGRMFPEQHFIGIDLKGNRIWKGASIANKDGLKNVAFVRSQIELTSNYFAKNEVDEIWITFPDPQLRWSKSKKRLTHPKFLRLYQQFLKNNGIVHLKTDNLYAEQNIDPRCLIKTYYEGLDIAQSNKIHYIQFNIDGDLPLELDEILKEAIKDIPMDAGELLRMEAEAARAKKED